MSRCQAPRHVGSRHVPGAGGGRRYDRRVAATTPESYLADLNPAQREAVLHTEGPVLVVAGAGSGKTRVLTRRIAHLLGAVGVKPPEILAITFTNKAAAEMRERVGHLVGPPARAAWVMTFHAACGRILRREAQRLGYRSNFTIYDQADQIRLTKRCLEELERDPKRFTPRGIHSQISNAKNRLVGPEEYAQRVASFYDQTVAEVFDLYQKRLFASNAVDFDDMLFLTVDVLERFPEARRALAGRLPLRARRRVPGHEPRPVPAPAAPRREAPERLRRRRPGPVPRRGDVGDDGGRHAAGRSRRSARATKCSPATAADASARHGSRVRMRRSQAEGIAITLASGRRIVSTARAHAFRRLQGRPDAAAPHDVPDVEAGSRVSDRDLAHVHEQP